MEDRECALFLASANSSNTDKQDLSFLKYDHIEVNIPSNEVINPNAWYQARNRRTNLTGYIFGMIINTYCIGFRCLQNMMCAFKI